MRARKELQRRGGDDSECALRANEQRGERESELLESEQEDDLKAWAGATLPRSTRQIGSWIEKEFGIVHESRSGLIALLRRLFLLKILQIR